LFPTLQKRFQIFLSLKKEGSLDKYKTTPFLLSNFKFEKALK